MAGPSARGFSQLVDQMETERICTIFAEVTANDKLAQTIAAELEKCEDVQVLSLHTGAVGPAGTDSDNYIGMMMANMDMIVAGTVGTR